MIRIFFRVGRWAPLLAVAAFMVAACDDAPTGPQAESCGPGPYLSVLPIPEIDLESVPVFGGMDAPGHVLPTPHGALFSDRAGLPLRAPADLTITNLRRVRGTGPSVPMTEDYAISFQLCMEMAGWFGHVVSLSPTFAPADGDYTECESYSVPWGQVESCEARELDIQVSAGDEIGTVDHFVDMGMTDERVTNFYLSPDRFPSATQHAVCMWEQFDAPLQAVLFSRLRDGRRPSVVPTGEPRCGTMEIDVAGTAKGVWAETGVGPVSGDERGYIALADYPYRPHQELVLSLGPDGLGARLAIVPQLASGRANVPFEQVMQDGLIYCYGPEVDPPSTNSWFLQLTSETELTIEWLTHEAGASPCDDDPTTWALGASAVAMVR